MRRENRSSLLHVRVTLAEKNKIMEFARLSGLDLSDYVRVVSLAGYSVGVRKQRLPSVFDETDWDRRHLPRRVSGRPVNPAPTSEEAIKPPDKKASSD